MVLTHTCLFVAFVVFAASSVRAAAMLQFELIREIPAADFARDFGDVGQVIDIDPLTGQFIIARGLYSDERPVPNSVQVFSVPFDGGPRTILFTFSGDAPMSRHALRILPNGNFVMPTPDGLTLREYDRTGMPVEGGLELTLTPQPPLEAGGAIVVGLALDFDHERLFVMTERGLRAFDLTGSQLASTTHNDQFDHSEDVEYIPFADTVLATDDPYLLQLSPDLRSLGTGVPEHLAFIPNIKALTFDPGTRHLHVLTEAGGLQTYSVRIVPEPTTAALAAVAGVLSARRRRKRRVT